MAPATLSPSASSYAKAPSSKDPTGLKVTHYDHGEDEETGLRPQDFVRGQWEVELNDWRRHCVPNGWMVCFCPCVSVAQIAARIGADSYGAALTKQLAFNLAVWAVVVVELVFCVRYLPDLSRMNGSNPWTSLVVVLVACFVVCAISFVWIKSLTKLRTRVRDRFQIDGSDAEDKYAMRWCTTCAIAQMATQTKSYTPGSCDFNAPDALPAYIP